MSEPTTGREKQSPPKPAEDAFHAAVAAASVKPLWEWHKGPPATEPEPPAPHVWRWETMSALVDDAARLVPMEHVERRVLTLMSPQLENSRSTTTTNLTGALQILMPGETALPHRHSANALRFVIEGDGVETVVNGKPCPMVARDMIITPDWAWHAHVHRGEGRMVWFDALDVQLYRHMDANFYQQGPPPNLPPQISDGAFATGGLVPAGNGEGETADYSPLYRYAWESVLRALDATPPMADGSRKLRYVNPLTGGPAMRLIECFVLALAQGRETMPYRSTSEAICVVADGEGSSRIGEHDITWRRNDIFTLPHWNWISHIAASDDAKLFMVTDRDALSRLGMLRDETRD